MSLSALPLVNLQPWHCNEQQKERLSPRRGLYTRSGPTRDFPPNGNTLSFDVTWRQMLCLSCGHFLYNSTHTCKFSTGLPMRSSFTLSNMSCCFKCAIYCLRHKDR